MSNRFDNGSIVAVQTVPHSQTDKYGIVKTGSRRADLLRVEKIVEKPKPSVAPSNLAVVGRYLLTPRIFTHLERIGEGAGGEIQLTDGIARLMNDEAVLRVPLRRQALRLRQQAGLPAGQRGIRAGASRARRVVQGVPEESSRSSSEATQLAQACAAADTFFTLNDRTFESERESEPSNGVHGVRPVDQLHGVAAAGDTAHELTHADGLRQRVAACRTRAAFDGVSRSC
jgi:hypothetical protein